MVELNNPPDPPTDADDGENRVDEGAAVGTPVGVTVQASDPDGDSVQYSLMDDAGGRFQIDPLTGDVSVADGSLLDGDATYTITVKATDPFGESSSAPFEIAVSNVAPTLTVDPLIGPGTRDDKAEVGQAVTVSGSFTDPASLDTHTLIIDWGDGANNQTVLPFNGAPSAFSQSHAYSTGGIFTITVTVIDDDTGAATDSSTGTSPRGAGASPTVPQGAVSGWRWRRVVGRFAQCRRSHAELGCAQWR